MGEIHSHVSAVTGVSAEAFREAIEKFADAIAQNLELSDESRQLVLETIDVAAEEALRLGSAIGQHRGCGLAGALQGP